MPKPDPALASLSEEADPLSFLGFGFHIYGRAELKTGTTTAVISGHGNATTSTPTDPFTYTRNGYTSRTQVESAIATEVDLDYSGIAFSGEFDATYAAQTRDDASSSYGLADIVVPASLTALTNIAEKNWADGFTADPDVEKLPPEFNDETRAHFFRVLVKYGTHLVSEITFGGRLRAVSYCDDHSQYSQQQAAANMALEYDGLFSSMSGSGSASWQQLDQSWVSSRSFYMTALGGDASLVPIGDHGYDATFDPAPWIKSVADAPTPATFRLVPLSMVFTGPTQTAMSRAIDAFLDSTVQLVINTDQARSYATIGTTQVPAPAPTPGPETGGWLWVLLLDPRDSSIVLNTRFASPDGLSVPAQVDEAVRAAVKAHPHLIVTFGGLWPWGLAAMVPQSLEALADLNGYELTPSSSDAHGTNLCYVGSTSRHDHYAASSSDWGLRCSNTVNISCDPLTVVDQDGHLL